EMDRRYDAFAELGKRNITEYNSSQSDEHMPNIVIVIDEMADLMMLAASDVENLIVRLAQKSRATGIHLVLATQRPSVNVITGLIKANIPARISFSTVSQIDSRTIIDQAGAEKLLGNGDMLFSAPEFIKPRRIQGVFVNEKEVRQVTDFLREAREPQYNDEVLNQQVKIGGGANALGDMGDVDDDLLNEAAKLVIESGKASASLIQRRLRVGYSRAARLLDLLEERGIVSGPDGSRPRDVLVRDISEIEGDM
ncbi:MAG: DNA translocase FtsK, partial [Candidatus Saccharimonadales bacterium]